MTRYFVRPRWKTQRDDQRSIETFLCCKELLLDSQTEVAPSGRKTAPCVEILEVIGSHETQFRLRCESKAGQRFRKVKTTLVLVASFCEPILELKFPAWDDSARSGYRGAIRGNSTLRDGRTLLVLTV